MAKSKVDYAEPEYAQHQDKSKVPYYVSNLDDRISPELKELLETYSHIPRDQQSTHIHRIRDLAWEIRQYPCTGSGGWLKPQLRLLPKYPEILAHAKEGATVVDIGTFVGHDLRRLVYDGAHSDHLWGIDIVSHWDVGYELFNDRSSWKGHFVEADFLTTATNPALAPLRANTDVIVISQVLHQWVWAQQVRGATALVALTKPGSLVVGNQMGKRDAGEIVPKGFTVPLYVQSPESFARLWNEVGAATGTRWETQCWLRSWAHIGIDSKESAFMGPEVGLLEFTARRVE